MNLVQNAAKASDDIWGVFAFPWKAGNRARYLMLMFALPFLVIAFLHITFLLVGSTAPAWTWLLALGLGVLFVLLFGLQYRFVGGKMARHTGQIPAGSRLADEGLMVIDIVESPAVIALTEDALIIDPLVGSKVQVPLSGLQGFEERHWYNGSQYWGDNAFFKLAVPTDNWRLGFAVSHPEPWRHALERIMESRNGS